MKNASKDEWKADNTIIVSGKDFDIDAKNFAKKHKIECYKLKGKKDFECVVSFDMEK